MPLAAGCAAMSKRLVCAAAAAGLATTMAISDAAVKVARSGM